jgi:hypothetical protein
MPADARAAMPELEERAAALRRILTPASEGLVRKWITMLFATMDSRESGEEAATRKDLMTRSLGLPAFCFRPDTLTLAQAAQRRPGQTGVWVPSYARLLEILDPLVKPYRDELAALEAVVRSMEAAEVKAALPPPRDFTTDAEIEEWVAAQERRPADRVRRAAVERFLKTLRQQDPEMHACWQGRITARLLEVPEQPEPPERLELAPHSRRKELAPEVVAWLRARGRTPEVVEREIRAMDAWLARRRVGEDVDG